MRTKLTREDIIQALNQIEDQFPVDKWKVKDIYFWPILKNIIFSTWHKKIELELERKIKENQKMKFTAFVHLLIARTRAYFIWYLERFYTRKKVDVFFSGAFTHRVMYDGKFVNRYYDPIILNSPDLRYFFIEYGRIKVELSNKYPVYQGFKHIEDIAPVVSIMGKKRLGTINFNHSDVKEVLNNFASLIDVSQKQLEAKLQNSLYVIEGYAAFFEKLMQKQQPRIVMGLCYYNKPMYGMNLAAARAGVTSIDMQHGGLGNLHPSYNGFKKLPVGGYKVLPKIFWTWDEISSSTLSEWTDNKSHKVIVGGNPWHFLSLRNGIDTLYKIEAGTKSIVLYTLQYTFLDQFIIDAIKETKKDFLWCIRMHPRKIHEKEVIINKLSETGLADFVNVIQASEYPLPQLLIQAQVHISKFSGSINEANSLGIPNIVIGDVGEKQFEKLIKSGEIVFYKEKDPLLSLAECIRNTSIRKENQSVNTAALHRPLLTFQNLIRYKE